MPQPIAVFDIDGTIFRSSLLIEITNALIKAGLFPAKAADAYSREYRGWLNRTGSYQTYLDRVVAVYIKYVTGLPAEEVRRTAATVIGDMSSQTYRYTRDLLTQLGKTHILLAISGSPSELVELFAKHYGFTDYSASEYEILNGMYTGVNQAGNVNKNQKLAAMVKKHGATMKGSIAVGDTEGDLSLLEAVEHPIAFNPSSDLFAEAVKRDWQIVVERKDVIYHYQHGRGFGG